MSQGHIVHDGYERAWKANIDRVRAEVEEAHAAELARAGFWRRMAIRRWMRAEVRRRMEGVAPPWGLY